MNGLRAATLDRAPPWESLHLYRSLSATTYNLRARGGQNNVRDNKWVKAQHNGVTEVYLWCHTWIKKINPEGITETGRVSVTLLAYSVFSYQHAPVQFSTSIPPAFPYFCYLVDLFGFRTWLFNVVLLLTCVFFQTRRVVLAQFFLLKMVAKRWKHPGLPAPWEGCWGKVCLLV